jgi:selenoprotein W-related protein
MADVSIVYCKPCGYALRAQDAATQLQKKLGVSVSLVAGKGGIFEVRVRDKVVAKRTRTQFPDTAAIMAAVSAELEVG